MGAIRLPQIVAPVQELTVLITDATTLVLGEVAGEDQETSSARPTPP